MNMYIKCHDILGLYMQLLTLSSPLHMAVFYNILAGLFVWQPDYLNCKHAARLADSDPGGANAHMQTHMCAAPSWRIDEKWPPPCPILFSSGFLLLIHALCVWMCCYMTVNLYVCLCVCFCVCAHICVKSDACHQAKWEVVTRGVLPWQIDPGPALNPPHRTACWCPLGALRDIQNIRAQSHNDNLSVCLFHNPRARLTL